MGYDKKTDNIDYIQEGNVDDYGFDLDTNFPVEDVGDITFQVRNSLGQIVFSKKMSTGGITLIDRALTVNFEPVDTIGKSGTHAFELDFKDKQGRPFATIGGRFKVNKELNTQ